MSVGKDDVTALLFFLIVWYAFEPFGRQRMRMKQSAVFYDVLERVVGKFSWIFGPVWLVLYGLNAGAWFVYWQLGTPPEPQARYTAVMVLMIVNIIANKLWVTLFFDMHQAGIALADLFVTFGTAVALLILFATAQVWLAFGLWMPYVLWLVAAIWLNVQFLRKLPAKRTSELQF